MEIRRYFLLDVGINPESVLYPDLQSKLVAS